MKLFSTHRWAAALLAASLALSVSCSSAESPDTEPAVSADADTADADTAVDDTAQEDVADEPQDDQASDDQASDDQDVSGDDASDEPQDASSVTYPVTISASNGDIVIDEKPTAIISLSPTATEMLFAIGAGEQVVAVDDMSDYPADAPQTELSGYTPNVEAIVGYSPDLVVLSDYSASGGDDSVGPALSNLGIPVLEASAAVTIDDVYAQISMLGTATDHEADADALVADMREAITVAIDSAPATDSVVKIYHEIDPTPFSVTSETFVGQVYAAFGLENIADAADVDGFGYPQMSVEAVVSADPDAIFLADSVCCQENAETVSARDGWGQVSAVQNGKIYELDDSVASRWGPRIVDMYEAVAKALADLG